MLYEVITKYIGAYTAVMGGVDTLIFAGGIGENGPVHRKRICETLGYLGIELDPSKNDGMYGKEMIISTPESKVKVMVIPTNEELVIAQDTLEIVKNM